MRTQERPQEHVTIVAANAETLDNLQLYLTRAGVAARATRKLDQSDADPCDAVVFFPDDFALGEVEKELRRLHGESTVLALLVTCRPAKFTAAANATKSGKLRTIIIPKPAWGWTILDTIRARLSSLAPR